MARQTLLIALGGNALIRKHQRGTIHEQFTNLEVPVRQIARLSRRYRVIITHGNGPQVGNLLLQQECCAGVPKLPLEILVAQTQGQIGYMIESTLDSALMDMGIHFKQPFLTLISYVVVDENDPALAQPTKPIGPVLSEPPSAYAFPTRRTAKGLRRVVASPQPLTVVEKSEIKKLVDLGFIVICCGGGGIPVIREGRRFHGVDAVIDKDLVSARLAEDIGVDHFIIATDVPGLAVDYGGPDERFLTTLKIEELEALAGAGHFPAGTVGPKAAAVSAFIRGGGRQAVVCALEDIEKAAAGEAGTRITGA